MNCNCKRKPRFVRGNAFSLNVKVKAKRPDGTPVSDFVLDGTATLLLMTSNGVATVLTYTVGDDNNAIVAFDGNLPVGIYGLDFQGSQDGTEWRFSDTNIFQVVEHTPQGHVPSDGVVYAEDTLEVDAEITLSTLSAQADWTETDPGAQSYIRNKPDLSTYATDAELATGLAGKQDTLTFDSTPTANSTNPVTSGGIKNYVDNHSASVTVDDALSTSSKNPVQNKVVTAALNGTVTNKGSNGNVRVGVGNYSNIDITSSSIGMETENGAILIGNDITLNTSGVVKYNGSRVATATDLQGKQDVIQDLSTIRSGASAGATAVQPAAMNTALAGKQDTISDLSTIRSGSAAGATAVQPATMNTALASKQDTLTFDSTPTANSNNPVKSGGVKTAIDAKQDTISTVNVTVDNNTGTPSGSASVSGGTLSFSFQNLKGATGAQGPQGIQGVQGIQGPKGDTGVSGDASSLAIIHGIDKTTSYAATDVCGADAAQALLNAIEGGFYY